MSFIKASVGVCITCLFLFLTFLALPPILLLAFLKWAIAHPRWQVMCKAWLDRIASLWMDANDFHQRVLLPTRCEVSGLGNLSRDDWYMMIANHQSWVDIIVLLRVCNRKIPYLKFFLKKSLIWVPLLGVAWWALDFPFMRRYSKAELARNPTLKGKDTEETRQFCEKFRHNPITIINFLEGTRFTPAKHDQQQSPYRHLLQPKAGGFALTLAAMDGQLHSLLDVTLYYPEGRPTYWQYACGGVGRIMVHVQQRAIPETLLGDYADDEVFRAQFQAWVNQLWLEKDAQLDRMMNEQGA